MWEFIKEHATVENVKTLLVIIGVLIVFIQTWRKKGLKDALRDMMRIIQTAKTGKKTPELEEAAKKISDSIKLETESSFSKSGKIIQAIYEAEVKEVEKYYEEEKTSEDGK